MRQMRPQELHDHLAQVDEPPLLLDVRENWEVRRSPFEGAMHVPMRKIPDVRHQLDPERETVVICHHGVRSMQVARFLEQAGFTDVINLSGGIDAWAREVDPRVPVY